MPGVVQCVRACVGAGAVVLVYVDAYKIICDVHSYADKAHSSFFRCKR